MNIFDTKYLTADVQARMPSIKGTLLPLDYRRFLKASGATTLDSEGKHHFYMPTVMANEADVAKWMP